MIERNGEAGTNHVADGYFTLAYAGGAAAAVLAVAAAFLLVTRRWRLTAMGTGALALAVCGIFLAMHRTAALVTYSEFLRIYGP